MLAVFLAPFYLLFNFYIFRWLLRWMSSCTRYFQKPLLRGVVLFLYAFLALSILLAFLWPARWLYALSNLWFGSCCYILLIVAAADLIRLVLKYLVKVPKEKLSSRKVFVTSGAFCILLILSLSVLGYIGARNIRTTHYEVTVDKSCQDLSSLRIVLAADLHLGYNMGNDQMKRMVEKINAADPDLVVIAGDFFDNDFDAVEDPETISATLRQIRSRYGTYACYGNHDIQEKILAGFTFPSDEKKESDPRMDAFLADSNIQLMQDETLLIDDAFYLIGRADRERPGRGIQKRMTPQQLTEGLDQTKPILVLDHEPDELSELAAAGADLELSGHTHDGQLFPANLIVSMVWENSCGYLEKDGMHSIVTSGVGVFGPNMRVGTKSEICVIDCQFLTGESYIHGSRCQRTL